MARWWLVPAILAPLAVAYILGSLAHSEQVNTDVSTFDQSAYLHYAHQMRATGFSHTGDRNRMPLYPFLQSWVCSPGLDDDQVFERAKRLNILLSVVILIVLYPIQRLTLPPPATVTMILILAFTVFIFKAAYVQCELVYYLLGFCAFLSMLSILQSPDWKRGILAGALLGLTQLTKASALPGLALFLLVGSGWYLARGIRSMIRPTQPTERDRPAAGLLAVGAVLVTFLVVVFPYIRTSKEVFGRYFYNVNSTFYIWYDTQDEMEHGTRLHGDREGWPKLPADQIPGPAKYFREHSARQAADRVVSGLNRLHQTAMRSYGYYKYLLIYAGFTLLVVIVRPRAWLALMGERKVQLIFCLCYFTGYLILFAWGSASLWGANRIGLQLFLPMMFCFAAVIDASTRRLPQFRFRGISLHAADLFHIAILCLLVPEIYLVLTHRLTTIAGGH